MASKFDELPLFDRVPMKEEQGITISNENALPPANVRLSDYHFVRCALSTIEDRVLGSRYPSDFTGKGGPGAERSPSRTTIQDARRRRERVSIRCHLREYADDRAYLGHSATRGTRSQRCHLMISVAINLTLSRTLPKTRTSMAQEAPQMTTLKITQRSAISDPLSLKSPVVKNNRGLLALTCLGRVPLLPSLTLQPLQRVHVRSIRQRMFYLDPMQTALLTCRSTVRRPVNSTPVLSKPLPTEHIHPISHQPLPWDLKRTTILKSPTRTRN